MGHVSENLSTSLLWDMCRGTPVDFASMTPKKAKWVKKEADDLEKTVNPDRPLRR
jgi:hypothetical protein